ncbi:MAG: glycosyltransferase [Bacteroidales bacterium]|nr:glycosyltransferase [Bacteroidales bacterium]
MTGKKILCLVIHSLQVGGMERVVSELAGYFCKKSNIELHLLLYGRKPEIFYPVPENLIIHKPEVVFNNHLRFFYTIGRLNFLRKTIKKIKPDSILSFGEYWNSFVLLALYGLNYPTYISDRCSPQKKFGIIHQSLRKWLYPKAKGIIAQTEKAKDVYEKQHLNRNITVIGNPIHKINNYDTNKEKIVLTVGRLISTKNHDKLIDIFCKINLPDWKFSIIGGNALKEDNLTKLNMLISEYKAESKVLITGFQSNLDIIYKKCSIFVFASESEGFPNVVGEAMSAGLPVIAFDCMAGPSEMITDGENGYLVKLHDFETFKERLELLMNDAELREIMGLKAKESIKKFYIEYIGDKYYKFIFGN